MEKFWKFINGNKTIICSIAWLIVSKGLVPINPEWLTVIEYTLMALTGGSLAHHVKKGYLTQNKG